MIVRTLPSDCPLLYPVQDRDFGYPLGERALALNDTKKWKAIEAKVPGFWQRYDGEETKYRQVEGGDILTGPYSDTVHATFTTTPRAKVLYGAEGSTVEVFRAFDAQRKDDKDAEGKLTALECIHVAAREEIRNDASGHMFISHSDVVLIPDSVETKELELFAELQRTFYHSREKIVEMKFGAEDGFKMPINFMIHQYGEYCRAVKDISACDNALVALYRSLNRAVEAIKAIDEPEGQRQIAESVKRIQLRNEAIELRALILINAVRMLAVLDELDARRIPQKGELPGSLASSPGAVRA